MRVMLIVLYALTAVPPPAAQAPEGYYRQPAIHGDTVVFVAEGDLWGVPVSGGAAQRLTTHAAAELYPAISPDGRTLAFAASYEGPREVYTMPLRGGLPTRRTFAGARTRVEGWTPRGEVLYASQRFSTLPSTQLAAIDLTHATTRVIPLAQAAEGSFDDRGRTLYFTRLARQTSHVKRYRGGTAQNIWKYTAGDAEGRPLTDDYPGTSRRPQWWLGRIYFASDRDGSMNIWSMDSTGGALRQHTFHAGWDVRRPYLEGGRIVYQLGADIRLYDIPRATDRRLPITLPSDFEQTRRRWVQDPMEHLSAVHIAPDGQRIVLTSYGQVFVAPIGQGRLLEAVREPGVRYRSARFMPDGQSLLALSDQSGEVEWWRLSADGTAPPEQLTHDGVVLRFDGVPSPNGRWIAYYDQNQKLYLHDIRKHKTVLIDESPQWRFDRPAWSPDSRWLAYAREGDNSIQQVHLYEAGAEAPQAVTTDRFNSYSAVWSPDGKWLYFLSDRTFTPRIWGPWGDYQPEPYFDERTKIYMLALQAGLRSPFQPEDELHPRDEASGGGDSGAQVHMEMDGLAARLWEVPLPPGNYTRLSVGRRHLYWLAAEQRESDTRSLMSLEIGDAAAEPSELMSGVDSYELAADGRTLLVRCCDSLYAGSGNELEDGAIDLSAWRFEIDPREKWCQMFIESWRLERDYFYDPEMHGLDWPAILEKYLPLVTRVTTRGELSDLQGQMASELAALHTTVRGGDHREGADQIEPASLGARLVRDAAAGGFRVSHIYGGDPDLPGNLSPLTRPGVDVAPGDIILAINGEPTLSVSEPGALLRDQAGRQVRLRVRTPGEKPRDVIVTPLTPEEDRDLRYREWEVTRREAVEALSEDRIGYVHLRAMGGNDMAEWFRSFYPVFNRQGLIIDMRHNNGGNIDSWILGRLLRRAWMYWKPRVGDVYWNMQYAFRGHMVVLVNEWTSSDGEAFAEGFRRLGLGKVIGTRTWGGEIWLTSSNRLVDRGIVSAAEFGVFGPEGVWLIEGHGVDPDIVVDNLPHATFGGQDAQLEAAVEHLQALIERDPRPVPPAPPYPDKTVPGH